MTTSTLTKTDYCENLISLIQENIDNQFDVCPESAIQLLVGDRLKKQVHEFIGGICPCCNLIALAGDDTTELINKIIFGNVEHSLQTQIVIFFDIHVEKGFSKKAKFFLERFGKSYLFDGTELIEETGDFQVVQ